MPSVTEIEITVLILSEKLYCCFHIHHQLMFGYISLHSTTLVPNNSFIMLVNILLFQHYSCQNYTQNYASIIGSGLLCGHQYVC